MEISQGISFHVQPSAQSQEELENLLHQLVAVSGGSAGVLTAWSLENPDKRRSLQCGLKATAGRRLIAMTVKAAKAILTDASASVIKLQRAVEAESQRIGLGNLHALVVPLMVEGSPVGVFCLLHHENMPGFLRNSPQMYNLVVDRLELVVRNAGLLTNLLRERRWFETLVNKSNDGVAILDRESKIVGINPAMEKLIGWKVAEVVGCPGHEILPLAALNSAGGNSGKRGGLALYRQTSPVSLPISAEPVEAELLDRDGHTIFVEVSGLTVRDEFGTPNGWVMTVRDIRRRKETERLGRIFFSAMSHELQTPIAVIKGFAGLISDPDITLKPEILREKAAIILDESDKLQQMVRQMLEAASIQAGGISLNCESVDIKQAVQRTVRRLEPLATEKNIKLVTSLPTESLTIWADLGKVEQVLVNLTENAVKYGQSGEVTLEARRRGQEVFVCVTDNGPGVAEEDQQRIFEIFQRGDEVKKKIRGSGLGLFICKSIVEAHGGRIGVTRGPGGGACFYFSLPGE